MLAYKTYNDIRFLRDSTSISDAEIARRLHLCTRTVKKWATRERYEPRKTANRCSILDPYKPTIRRDWELGGCTGTFIFNRLRQAGYTGGQTIINVYLRSIRRKQLYRDKQTLLPFEWMLKLIQGKLTSDFITTDIGTSAPSEDIDVLVQQVRDGSLRFRNRAVAILAHSPPQVHGINRTSWRMDDLKNVLRQQGVVINKDSIRLIIRNAGYRFRSAKRVLTSTDPEYSEKLAEVTRTLSGLTETQKFFSIDEFGPFAVKVQGGRALTAPGQDRAVPQWQKSKGSLTLIGALELSTNQITHFYATQKSTVEMIKLTQMLLKQYTDESLIYLSWDAASWHASKAFFAEVARLNEYEYRALYHTPSIALVPLPASAQFLNVIESIFSGMARAIIHNSDYDSTEDCKRAIDRYFIERNEFFKLHPKRAGDKIWGKERVPAVFSPSNNCKDPLYR